jgi:hypothetical protein
MDLDRDRRREGRTRVSTHEPRVPHGRRVRLPRPAQPNTRLPTSTLEPVMDTLGIIRQIESDPGLRAQLRAVLLGDELLGLPGQVAQMIEVQRQMQAVLEAMVERMDRMEERQDRMEADVGVLKGSDLERRVRERPRQVLPEGLARTKVLDDDDLDGLIERLHRKRALTPEERRRLVQTDLLVAAHQGTKRVTVVAEVSATLHANDVTRVAESARILNARNESATALAIGYEIGGEEVERLAADQGVELVIGF